MWLYVVFEIIVNFFGLMFDMVISVVFNVCIVVLNIFYLVFIVCKMLYGRFEKGLWNLGRWSFVMNVVVVGWNMFMVVIFFFFIRLLVVVENVSFFVCFFGLGSGRDVDFWNRWIMLLLCLCLFWCFLLGFGIFVDDIFILVLGWGGCW